MYSKFDKLCVPCTSGAIEDNNAFNIYTTGTWFFEEVPLGTAEEAMFKLDGTQI